MSLEEAFLRDIHERPHDDTPRLVYADWLDENGRPERAEFIRVQCRLAELPTGHAERPALERREQALLRKHVQEWRKPLPPRHLGGPFYRGFVTPTLALGADNLTPAFRPPECAPLWGAWVSGERGGVVDLADHPVLDRLVGLWLHQLPETWLQRLVASPRLRHLLTLDAELLWLGSRVAAAIAGSPHLARLSTLNLGNNPVGADAGRALAASPHLRRLRELVLHVTQLGDAGVIALAGSPVLDTVVRLNLNSNDLTDRAADALIESPHLAHVRKLELAHNNFSEPRWAALRKRFGKRLMR